MFGVFGAASACSVFCILSCLSSLSSTNENQTNEDRDRDRDIKIRQGKIARRNDAVMMVYLMLGVMFASCSSLRSFWSVLSFLEGLVGE